jgi:hypothetical protein
MSKNLIFGQKMTKLWACQISQNKKKHPVYSLLEMLSISKHGNMKLIFVSKSENKLGF